MFRVPFRRGRAQHAADIKKTGREALVQHDLERKQFKEVLESFHATRIRERLAVLDAFLSIEQHVTIAELENLIKDTDPDMHDRSFLKETMEMFCQFGFAREIAFENLETQYEHNHLGTHHDHFICTRCGLIQEFVDNDLERMQLSIARDYQFHSLQHKTEIYGLCAGCMKRRDAVLPLTLAARGEKVEIVEIRGGRQNKARLAAMGITAGCCLEVITNHAAGQFLLAVNGTRMAIGAGLAQKILVTHACRHREQEG